jgi:Ser/Thr protein kinase RdoA (MazF antagonist)
MHPTPELLRRFGLGTPTGGAVEAARGAIGRIFRVETSTGVWAIKQLFAHTDAHAPPQPLETQASLIEAASRTGVTAPRIVRSRDGHIVASLDGVRWRAFEWIDVVSTPTLHQAGATLARLHAAGWPTAAPLCLAGSRRRSHPADRGAG